MDHPASEQAQEDPFNLNRFVEAQEEVYEGALAELRRGDKRGHWNVVHFPTSRRPRI